MKSRWTIGKKLIVSFLGVAAITLILGVVGYYGVSRTGEAIDQIGEIRLPGVESLLVMKQAQTAVESGENALMSRDLSPEARQRERAVIKTAWDRAHAARERYESLPQTAEESRKWSEFVSAWNSWEEAHEAYMTLIEQFEETGIVDPVALERNVEGFSKDHYRLEFNVLDYVLRNRQCEGGCDSGACRYGKWVSQFKTNNPDLRELVDDTGPSHEAFHNAVKETKELVSKGEKDAAVALIYGKLAEAAERTFGSFDKLLAKASEASGLLQEATDQALNKTRVSYAKSAKLLDELVAANSAVASKTVRSAVSTGTFLQTISIIAMVVGVVAALALGVLISRSVNKVLRRIASGLSAGAEQTASAANQVASASQSLAQGASEQAASLEETTSSIEQMSSMTNQNANNSEEAASLMNQARDVVEGMAQATGEMSEAIADIKTSSGETAKIIKTIEEIAFQTNLLALNAAVEAARAGEAGKGFAVVAEEVRNLAQRAAEAARDTATMIEGSVNNADNGVAVTERVTEAVERTVENATKVNELILEIAAASKEQAQGIGQINTAMGQMDQVTQSNAANAEESASASEQLSAQAEEMRRTVLELQALVGGRDAHAGPVHAPASATGSATPKPHRYAPKTDRTAHQAQTSPQDSDGDDWLTADSEKELAHF